jgi:CDP-glycerol glycerophosphotransferase
LDCRILKIEDIDNLKDNKLILYGAGKYGSFLYSFLEEKNLAENVICFAVTDNAGNADIFCGKPVKCLDQITERLKDCTVILALGEKASAEVLGNLQNCTVKDICCVNGQVIEDIIKELIIAFKKLPLQENKIILSSYDGMGYRCNSKYIAEKLLEEKVPVELVWLVSDNGICDVPDTIKKVVIGSPEFYREVLTAKVYITNTVHLLYEHKREGQFFINTWHGYGPFKLAEGDVNRDAASKERYTKSNGASDLFLTASSFYGQIYRRSFYYQGEVAEYGAPRNDVFFRKNDFGEKIRNLYQIPLEKGIVLYAPTYRSMTGDDFKRYNPDWERILASFRERFGKEYVVVYKLHHYMQKLVSEKGLYEQAVEATFYSDMQELLVAADIVITDYSSLMWDFSLQRRPVFLYQNDEEQYANDRGFYAPVSEWSYPKAHSEEELVEQIRCFDEEKYIVELNAFLKNYGSCDDGHASERVVKRILEVIV